MMEAVPSSVISDAPFRGDKDIRVLIMDGNASEQIHASLHVT